MPTRGCSRVLSDGARLAARLLAAAALVSVALLLGACSRAEPETGEFRIGLLAPLTNSPMRFTAHRAARELVERLNAAGGLDLRGRKVPVRLFVEDTGGQIESTMSAVGRLIQQEHVTAVVGPYFSREAIPAVAATEAARVLLLTPTATNPLVTRGRKFAFRVCQVDSDQGRSLARFAFDDLGFRRVAVLFDEADDYSSGLAGYFRDAWSALPGATALMLAYAPGTEDFKERLNRTLAFKAQALFLPNFQADLTRQLGQARAAGFHGMFLGGDSWDSGRSFHTLPEAQGACFSVEYAAGSLREETRRAAEELTAKAGAELDKNTALTLDAMELLFAAARAVGGTDSVSLRSGLTSLQGFKGLTGSISFERGGDPLRSVRIMTISGGRLVERKELPPVR